MELDILKSTWSSLSEQLSKNEQLNKRIIHEMITRRTETAHSKLFRMELYGLIVIIGLCLLYPLIYSKTSGTKLEAFILIEGLLLFALFMQVWIMYYLVRFDVTTGNLIQLNKWITKYKTLVKINYTYGAGVALAALVIFFIIQQVSFDINFFGFVFILMLLVSAFTYFIVFRFYKKNIREVEKGIEELAENEMESESSPKK